MSKIIPNIREQQVEPRGIFSGLLAGGADLQTVKERLGHGTITTTERYLHTLNGADDTALTALTSIRRTAR